ncbi:hypothetical protein SteCoe_23655 [Stentor coeruleus]|uniref:Cation efflux protein cytoplasmic domain-containing protein n=1 Tax=Stentor coeruleus TaxID=5963 RepID=A0A1R2BJB5_9CILI|nr:hypothetical protein SteCoe_23655 [Stentor coeruleus]
MYACTFFAILVFIVELVGGLMAGSLAIMTDVINTLADVSIFLVGSICSAKSVSRSSKMSYGYYRVEILGFLMSVAIIWALSIWLVYECVYHILESYKTNSLYMLICAVIGFVYNLIIWMLMGKITDVPETKYRALYVNMKTKHTHFLIELVESAIIIIAAIGIHIYPEMYLIDPICALILIVVVYIYTFKATYDSIGVLMERAPMEINLSSLKTELKDIQGVMELHDLHVWSLNLGIVSMSCHLAAANPIKVLEEATRLCNEKYGIHHTTIQVEEPCEEHNLDCENSLKLK